MTPAPPQPGAPLADDDCLPHDQAVWRAYRNDGQHAGDPPPGTSGKRVSIDFGKAWIVTSWGHLADWRGAKRWRFGWPPKRDR